MQYGSAQIVSFGEGGISASAAASRISTGAGTALDAFSKSVSRDRDIKLIGKVLSSGHNTVIEHAYFTVAFNDVSVLTEQLMIEHRLAAYTVKSRRYVDFTGAGYVIPALAPEKESAYRTHMDYLFGVYTKLLELGVPREDARFVLPYCFRSNFIMSVNARELAHIIRQMTEGRLSLYPEIKLLGEELARQLDALFPGVSGADVKRTGEPEKLPVIKRVGAPVPARQETSIVHAPADAEKLLKTALEFSGRADVKYSQLIRSERPRELEMLNYVFRVKDVSLACVTHFTRHRIQSLYVPAPVCALTKNAYVLPESISSKPEALALYAEAFESNARAAAGFTDDTALLSYFALAGNTVDIMFGMNARELLHFLRLRTCTRAQWEIRDASNDMLRLLRGDFPALFACYGPSCAVLTYCPEGRLSCGRIQKTEDAPNGK
ncbi:MAG: FAD-dependent thymidylate synthase [Clostridia bacterium]|nr:FAD-dependent thymidylate synthase [Clostridia bacterium]